MNLLIFSDLDGTLLDHASYDFAPARPMLAWLAAQNVPVVLASSKTGAEIAGWQARMGLGRWPAIVENGAALLEGAPDDAGYRAIRAALTTLPAPLRARFRGFGDMSVAEVAEVTGLPPDEAALAKQRAHSEPGLWSGTEAEAEAFLAALAPHGLSARRGGRFLTLSQGGTKAGRMAELVARFRPELTIALGDAPNDTEMIAAADRGVIVRNDAGTPLPRLAGEDSGRILRTTRSGPEGWVEGLTRILRQTGIATTGEAHG